MKTPIRAWKGLQEPSAYVGLCIILLSLILYLPFLAVPFLPDDYLQITLARNFGPIGQWRNLFDDPLFRNRATSLVLTYWTDSLFPLSPLACGTSSILLHAVNGILVYFLGTARAIGWRLSALTAIMFVLQERHHEAVIWYASLPELLVFMFVLVTLLLWIRWLHHDGASIALWSAALTSFALALLSKESAVAAICFMIIFAVLEKSSFRRTVLGLTPFVLASIAYVLWVFQGHDQNHHFSDGTFVLQSGFLKVAILSMGRGLWLWGWLALIFLVSVGIRNRKLLGAALVWMFGALLPYSFLTYMTTVPSRHHYLAAVGCSLVIALAMVRLSERRAFSRVIPLCFMIIGLHHALYLWTAKYRQFEKRSEPIEAFMGFLDKEPRRPVLIHCSDYLFLEAQRAAHLRRGEPEQNVVLDLAAADDRGPSYCLPKL